jgi:hypothetical protein
MKKTILAMVSIAALIGCGDNKNIDGIEVQTYGLYNEKDYKCENVHYSLVGQNIFLALMSGYSVVAPAAVAAFELWEPEGKIDSTKAIVCGGNQ